MSENTGAGIDAGNEDGISRELLLSILATGLLSFSGVIVETAMNITFPKLMKLFDVPLSTVQWMTTSYLLVLAMMMPLSAYLKRRFTTRNLFTVAASLFLLGLLVDAVAPGLGMLIAGRMLQGVGTGISLPLMFNIILEQAPFGRRGLLIGVGNFITATAPAIGPTFGGLLVDSTFGWRSIFWVMVPIVVIALIIGRVVIRQQSVIERPKLDIVGWLNLALLFSFLILGLAEIGRNLHMAMILGALALLSLVATIVWYRRARSPIIALDLFKQPWFTGHVLSFMLCQFTVMGLAFLLPNLMQIFMKQTSFMAGLVMLPGAALGAVLAPIGGGLLDRFGAKRPILAGITFELVAVVVYLLVCGRASIVVLAVVYMLFTLGQGVCVPNVLTNGLSRVPTPKQSDGNAIFNTLQQFAGAAGTSIVSVVIAADHTATQLNGFRNGLLVLAIAMAVNLVMLLVVFFAHGRVRTAPVA